MGYFLMVNAASSLLKERKSWHIEVAATVRCGTTLKTKLGLMTSKGQK